MAGTRVVRTEKTVRGPFGKLVKWGFILFNILMAIWLVSGIAAVSSSMGDTTNGAEQAGAAIGGTLGAGLILFIWVCGDVVLGLVVMMTRGKRIITEEHVS